VQFIQPVKNRNRTIGTMLSGEVARRYGHDGLPEDTIHIQLQGTAGQSAGAFLAHGITLDLVGEANDYVGKGLSGATIVVRPMVSSILESQDNAIIGNTVLYGATAGKLFASGQAGERFAVRNSGAHTVVEGCGSNGVEYMTGGVAVVHGPVGDNFAAGMTGGMAFVYDPKLDLPIRINQDSVIHQRIDSEYWNDLLVALIEEHIAETGSRHARRILQHWDIERANFWQICPREMLSRLKHPLSDRLVAATA